MWKDLIVKFQNQIVNLEIELEKINKNERIVNNQDKLIKQYSNEVEE